MSETTNLKLKKHDNVATNENPMNLEDYLNENWDIIDETFGTANNVIKDLQINVEDLNSENDKQNEDIEALKTDNDTNKENIETNASNIEKNTKDIELNTENIQTNTEDINTLKAQKEALEKELERQKEDNKLNGLTEDNSGELIHIDNSTGSRFNALEISGNEKQETREGYNLFDVLNATIQNQDKGVTITKNEDGSITANGTPTADWIVFIRDYGIGSKLEDGQTYSLWQENYAEEDMEGVYVQVVAKPNEGSSQTQKIYNASTIKKTFTVDKTNYNYQLAIQTGQISKAGTFENYKNRYMLYKGTDDKEFELYGAMPSFDYSSEVKCVGDNINIFDGETELGEFNGGTGDKINSSTTIRNKNPIYVKGLNKIIFSCNSEPQAVNFYEYDKNNSFLKYTKLAKNKYLELDTNTEYVNFSRNNNIDVSKIKVESGEKITDYSKFGQGNLHLKVLNKNFLDIQKNATVTKGGMTFTTDEDGVLTINGTATTNIYLRLDNNDIADNDIANWAKRIFKKGTYVFSVENLSGQTQDINMSAFIRNGAYAQDYATLYRFFKYEKTKSKFVLNEDVEGVVCLWIYSGITLNNAKLKFQLELEQEATDIVANEEQNYVIPVQQKMLSGDTFKKIDEVWKEIHTWQEVIFNGEENWLMNYGTSIFNLASNNIYNQSSTEHKALCNMAKFENRQAIMADLADKHFAMQSAYNSIFFKDTDFKTAEEFKAKLKELYEAGTPLKVAYKTDTPLILDCTPKQVEILDKIDQEAHTYSEVTNVFTEDSVGAIIKTNTSRNLETIINNVVTTQLAQIGG